MDGDEEEDMDGDEEEDMDDDRSSREHAFHHTVHGAHQDLPLLRWAQHGAKDEEEDEDDDWHSFDSNIDPEDVSEVARIFTLNGSEVTLESEGQDSAYALFRNITETMIPLGSHDDVFKEQNGGKLILRPHGEHPRALRARLM
jgi:hypothetical protein